MILGTFLHKLARWCWYLLAAGVVLCALLISLGQYYFPRIGEHERQIENEINARLPIGVRLSGLRGAWTGLAPTMNLKELRLYDPQRPEVSLLTLSQVELRVDLLRSLIDRAPRLRRLATSFAEIDLVEKPDGRWTLAGMVTDGGGQDYGPLVAGMVLAVRDITLERSRLTLDFQGGRDLLASDLRLELENFDGFRRLRAGIANRDDGSSLDLLVEASGDLRRDDRFALEAYLRLGDMPTAQFMPVLEQFGIALGDTRVSGELWLGRAALGALRVLGDVQVERLPVAIDEEGAWPDVERLESRFLASLQPGRRIDVDIERIALDWYGERLRWRDLHLERDLRGGLSPWQVQAAALEVAPLRRLALATGRLPARAQVLLDELAPRGQLRNVLLSVPAEPELRNQFSLRAEASDLSLDDFEGIPAGEGIAGYLEAGLSEGSFTLDARDFSVHFARDFEAPMRFSTGAGRVNWRFDEERTVVVSDLLQLESPQGEVDGFFRLDLVRDPEASDTLTLLLALRDADAKDYAFFLPTTIDPGLRRWLDGAVLGGTVRSGAFHLHTVVSGYRPPKRDSLQLLIEVEDAALRFDPAWPPVEQAAATIAVANNDVEVYARDGRLIGLQLQPLQISVARPAPDRDRRIKIRGDLGGELDGLLRLLNETPVSDLIGGATAGWRGEGELDARLALDLPLRDEMTFDAQSQLYVEVALDGAALELTEQDLRFGDLRGTLNFDLDTGLAGRNLTARLWDRPLVLSLGPTEPLRGAGSPVRIVASGEIDTAALNEWLRQPLLGFVSGVAPAAAELLLVPGEGVELRVDSSLEGVTIDAPAPLGKAAGAARPLLAVYRGSGSEFGLNIDYDAAGRAALQIEAGRVRGDVVIGMPGSPLQLPPQDVRIRGIVARAELDQWLPAIDRYFAYETSDTELAGDVLTELQVGRLSGLGMTLTDVDLYVDQGPRGTRVAIADDEVAGSILIPEVDTAPLGVSLQLLQLGQLFPERDETAEAAPEADAAAESAWPQRLDTAELPDMDVTIDRVAIGEEDLGRWSFALRPMEQGLRVLDLNAEVRGVRIAGREDEGGATLYWNWAEATRSGLDARLSSDDLEDAFRAWDQPAPAEARQTEVDLALQWPGAPQDFSAGRLSGWAEVELLDGRLLDVENAPILRLIGVLNLTEIVRRLRFDFDDFFRSGLTFDRFGGRVLLEDGQLIISDAIELKGPSSRFSLTGGADLRANTIDASLLATLPIGSNLPWLAALAGGPAVAAGVFVASQIFEEQMGRFSSARYRVVGPIDAPEVELDRVVRDGDGGRPAAPPSEPADTQPEPEAAGGEPLAEATGAPADAG